MDRTIEALASAGWEFKYDQDTLFVGAEHPDGGRITICEVYNTIFGAQIAHCLNQCGQEKKAREGGTPCQKV